MSSREINEIGTLSKPAEKIAVGSEGGIKIYLASLKHGEAGISIINFFCGRQKIRKGRPMKIYKAIIILIFTALIQASFLRLINFSPVLPNLLLVVLFLINYSQPFANILILSAVAGILADLFSAVNFGTSALAMTIVGTAIYLLREKFLKGKTFFGFAIISALAFPLFYLLLFVLNEYLNLIHNNFSFSANIVGIRIIKEIPADFALILIAYFFITGYRNPPTQSRLYGRQAKM
ncbi:rod shape-determining protein MreD [Patescibacteria group bacterium]|nr:rod shape-determining protein MreD [Patescibacteria group bacterium]MBU3999884.1 rod shape-determining protein MreD [Patescibacteria group bacterium]MBU4056406.1 rod shape-determining protein MreD [Patescibacteria group bacterium]MBU4368930.1 rod shape-determining protein MreD [Patescibacteria group bacterium]